MRYHVFPTEAACLAALDLTHQAMAAVAVAHGFAVVPGTHHVIGKNAATGTNNPRALTTKWSDPVELVGGQWGIPDIRSAFPTTYPAIEQDAGLPAPVEIDRLHVHHREDLDAGDAKPLESEGTRV